MNQKNVITKLNTKTKELLKKEKQPGWIEPMLCTLTDKYFSSQDFLYEHKWDGERLLAFKNNGKVTLLTRNKKDATQIYPEIAQQLENQDLENFIIDGEVVAMINGQSNFSLLQKKMHTTEKQNINLVYYIFDIMYYDQYNTTNLELLDRKYILENTISASKSVKITEYITENGLEYYHNACKLGWEGVIVKNIYSTYQQKRSKDWLKFKCLMQQELVIGGFTKPHGERLNFGAILVGYYKNNELIFAGKVGTGFDTDTLNFLGKKFEKLKQDNCPFKSVDINTKEIYWLKPELVAEIKFSEWTKNNKLRHPRFMGLRDDKSAKDVVLERPEL